MLLVIDLGNTTLTLGVFNQHQLVYQWRLTTDRNRTEDEYGLQLLGLLETCGLKPPDIDGIVLSSVVPPLTEWVQRACGLFEDRSLDGQRRSQPQCKSLIRQSRRSWCGPVAMQWRPGKLRRAGLRD